MARTQNDFNGTFTGQIGKHLTPVENTSQNPTLKGLIENCGGFIDTDRAQDEFLILMLREKAAARKQNTKHAGIIEVL